MPYEYKKGDKVKVLSSRVARFEGEIATIIVGGEVSGEEVLVSYYFPDRPELQRLLESESGNTYWNTTTAHIKLVTPAPVVPYSTNVLGDFPKRS